jgi:hypothetical protein
MLRLVRRGMTLSPPIPRENDGSVELASQGPSMHVSCPRLGPTDVKWLEAQLSLRFRMALLEATVDEVMIETSALGEIRGTIDLGNLALAAGRTRELEQHMGQELRELLLGRVDTDEEGLMAILSATCVTTSPGEYVDVSLLRDLLAHPPRDIDPNLPMEVEVRPASGDVLILGISPIFSKALPEGSVAIGLGSAVDWSKQVMCWTTCRLINISSFKPMANRTSNGWALHTIRV